MLQTYVYWNRRRVPSAPASTHWNCLESESPGMVVICCPSGNIICKIHEFVAAREIVTKIVDGVSVKTAAISSIVRSSLWYCARDFAVLKVRSFSARVLHLHRIISWRCKDFKFLPCIGFKCFGRKFFSWWCCTELVKISYKNKCRSPPSSCPKSHKMGEHVNMSSVICPTSSTIDIVVVCHCEKNFVQVIDVTGTLHAPCQRPEKGKDSRNDEVNIPLLVAVRSTRAPRTRTVSMTLWTTGFSRSSPRIAKVLTRNCSLYSSSIFAASVMDSSIVVFKQILILRCLAVHAMLAMPLMFKARFVVFVKNKFFRDKHMYNFLYVPAASPRYTQ